DGDDISHMHRAAKRYQVVSNRIAWRGLLLFEHVVIASDIQRQLLLLELLLIRRIPGALRRPVGNPVAALANCYVSAASRLRSRNRDLPGQREAVAHAKIALAHACPVYQHFYV